MPHIYIENLPEDTTPKTVEALFGTYLGNAKHEVELLFEDQKPYVAIVNFPDLSYLGLQQIEKAFHRRYFGGRIVRVHASVFD